MKVVLARGIHFIQSKTVNSNKPGFSKRDRAALTEFNPGNAVRIVQFAALLAMLPHVLACLLINFRY